MQPLIDCDRYSANCRYWFNLVSNVPTVLCSVSLSLAHHSPCLYLSMSLWLSICLSVCLPACLPASLSLSQVRCSVHRCRQIYCRKAELTVHSLRLNNIRESVRTSQALSSNYHLLCVCVFVFVFFSTCLGAVGDFYDINCAWCGTTRRCQRRSTCPV